MGRDLWWPPSSTASQSRASPRGTAGCAELHPAGFLVFPWMETAPPLRAAVPACDRPHGGKLSPSSSPQFPSLPPVFVASCPFAVLLREELDPTTSL